MSHRLTSLLLLVTLIVSQVRAAAPAPVPADDDPAVVRQRIDDLLKLRRRPEPLPVDPPNPFVMLSPVTVARSGASTARAANEESAPSEAAPRNDTATILAQFASGLRISGIIRVKDQVQIIINDNAWKEGEFITIERGTRVVRLQVARIQPGQLTLRLDDAELVLRF